MKAKRLTRALCLFLALVMGALLPVPAQAKSKDYLEEKDGTDSYYAVQVGSSTSLNSAKITAERLKEQGHEAYLYVSSHSSRYKVMVGAFAEKADAEALLEELQGVEVRNVKMSSAIVAEVKLSAESAKKPGGMECVPGTEWSGIKDIIVDWYGMGAVGLRKDGTLAFAGKIDEGLREELSGWTDIERLEYYASNCFIGYRRDGGVRIADARGRLTEDESLQKALHSWKNVQQLYRPFWINALVCLRKDGTVDYAVGGGDETAEQALHPLRSWSGIGSLLFFLEETEAGGEYRPKQIVLGLKKNGTVVCTDQEVFAKFCTEYSYDETTDLVTPGKKQEWKNVKYLGAMSVDYALDGPYALQTDGTLLWGGIAKETFYSEDSSILEKPIRLKEPLKTSDDIDRRYAVTEDGEVLMVQLNTWQFRMERTDYGEHLASLSRTLTSCMGPGVDPGLALREDGTVFVDTNGGQTNTELQEAVSGWKKVRLLYSRDGALALTADGRVLAADEELAAATEDWTDVRELFLLDHGILGLKNDGTVLACGDIELN